MTQFLGKSWRDFKRDLKLLAAFLWVVVCSLPGALVWLAFAGAVHVVVGERRGSAIYCYYELLAWGKSELFWAIKAPPIKWAVPDG